MMSTKKEKKEEQEQKVYEQPTAQVMSVTPQTLAETLPKDKWKLQCRWDTAENWRTLNPLLLAGEKGIVSDSPSNKREYRVGDGVNRWNDLQSCYDWDGELPAPTPGKGLTILGTYASLEALRAGVPSPAAGDAYNVGSAVPYNVYIYDSVAKDWKDNGQISASSGGVESDGFVHNREGGIDNPHYATAKSVFDEKGAPMSAFISENDKIAWALENDIVFQTIYSAQNVAFYTKVQTEDVSFSSLKVKSLSTKFVQDIEYRIYEVKNFASKDNRDCPNGVISDKTHRLIKSGTFSANGYPSDYIFDCGKIERCEKGNQIAIYMSSPGKAISVSCTLNAAGNAEKTSNVLLFNIDSQTPFDGVAIWSAGSSDNNIGYFCPSLVLVINQKFAREKEFRSLFAQNEINTNKIKEIEANGVVTRLNELVEISKVENLWIILPEDGGLPKFQRNEYTRDYSVLTYILKKGKKYDIQIGKATVSSAIAAGFIPMDVDATPDGTLTEILAFTGENKKIKVEPTEDMKLVVARSAKIVSFNQTIYSVDPVKTTDIIESVKKRIDNIENCISGLKTLKITIPDKIFAIEGTELNLWNDEISLSADRGLQSPLNYITYWECEKGIVKDRCFSFLPQSSDVSHTPIQCKCIIYDMSFNVIDTKIFDIVVLAKNALSKPTNIVYFGDSTGPDAATELFKNFNNPSKYTGTKPRMLGTRGTSNKYEAVGGYTFADYATEGRNVYRVNVTSSSPLAIGDTYKIVSIGKTFEIREINISDGSGNLLLEYKFGSAVPDFPTSGELEKVSGSGDEKIPFTNGKREPNNPLWNENTKKLDVALYKERIGLSTSEKIDAVSFRFGINGYTIIDRPDELRKYITDLYDAFIADNPNCKILLGLTTSAGNDVNGSGFNYGATWNYIEYCDAIYRQRLFYIALSKEPHFKNMVINPECLNVDRYYGYAFGSREISQRHSTKEQVHINYVHPGESGYGQIADVALATYIGILTNEPTV